MGKGNVRHLIRNIKNFLLNIINLVFLWHVLLLNTFLILIFKSNLMIFKLKMINGV